MPDHGLREPALVVHAFFRSPTLSTTYPVTPGTVSARTYLRRMWSACQDLGMADPVGPYPHLPGPDDLPDNIPYSASAAIRAARASGPSEADDQAVLWSRGDVTGLSLALPRRPGTASTWESAASDWAAKAPVGPVPDDVLGVTLLARALGRLPRRILRRPARADALAQHVSSRLGPFSGEPGPWTQVAPGRLLWEIHRMPADPGLRTLVVLGGDDEAALDAWLWHTGTAEPAPLTRHLLHAGLVRHHVGVLARAQEAIRACDRKVTEDADALGHLHASGVDDPRPLFGKAALDAETRMERLRAGAHDLAARRADLRSLRLTAEGLAANMRQAVPPDDHDTPGSPLTEDRRTADWLAQQADDAAEHLNATMERAESVIGLGGTFVAEQAQAQRQHASLMQGALVGGLLALLAAVQSLQYQVRLPAVLEAPVIAILALLAVVLPTGGLRLLRGGRQQTTPVFFDLAGLALLGGLLGWLLTTVAFYLRDNHAAPVAWSLTTATLCSFAAWLSARARFKG
ncbi:CATRA conflict system CASPASE/TPR repeat-associated protein [Streptomyces brasiliscabiei]|uniref:CATRA conflict system CASPASE/TPR repeat-associated protein n=1 Tax=Streptomyces brasiliscabiei TaxID=2736302 RepID=UPI001C11DB25|nr:CATRA conflict system CASPASE/TPR repeat-associated protein [Streptomyces brasiliscabiei]